MAMVTGNVNRKIVRKICTTIKKLTFARKTVRKGDEKHKLLNCTRNEFETKIIALPKATNKNLRKNFIFRND